MNLLLVLLMVSLPAECRVARIEYKAKKHFETCEEMGHISFVARYFTRDGERIDAEECGISPPSWGADRFMDLDDTGFRAMLLGVHRKDEPVVSIAMMQGKRVFIFERAVK